MSRFFQYRKGQVEIARMIQRLQNIGTICGLKAYCDAMVGLMFGIKVTSTVVRFGSGGGVADADQVSAA
jgi:hypothetical protein